MPVSCCAQLQARLNDFNALRAATNSSTQHGRNTDDSGFVLKNQGALQSATITRLDTRTLQAFMGHRSIANTVVYTAVADKRVRNIWGEQEHHMDEARRERIRELIGMLEYIQERVEEHLMVEDGAFDNRSPPSKESEPIPPWSALQEPTTHESLKNRFGIL